MKRLYLLLVLLVLALAACGSATTQATTATPTATATIHVGSVTNPDGSITVTHADGSTTTYWPTPVPTKAPTQVPTPVPTQVQHGWVTTHSYSGNGDQTTEMFTVPDHWKIAWVCHAIPIGDGTYSDGGLAVGVMAGPNNYIDSFFETCKASDIVTDGTQQEYQGGQVYLQITGAGDWQVQVQEYK